MNILFVCTGNTCRSCMAEAISKNLIEKDNSVLDVEFSSAGVYAVKGHGASENAVRAMKEMGIDITHHIATSVSRDLLNESDLILTLTAAHKVLIISQYPDLEYKIFTLLEYVGDNGDIADPFGGDIAIYRNCSVQIKNAIEKLLLILKER